jgi:hypothetical protein
VTLVSPLKSPIMAMIRPVRPVSSQSSRRAVCCGVSPESIRPFGRGRF